MPKITTHLDAVSLSAYNMEAFELIDGLVCLLRDLERASGKWKAATQKAERIANDRNRDLRNEFYNAGRASIRAQGIAFRAIEAFLAGWARLSLLFFPIEGKTATAKTRMNRGDVLRKVWLVHRSTSPLNDRELRDAWMHFDERLDSAIASGTAGNRHLFTTSAQGPRGAAYSVRVVEMDSLIVRYRDKSGTAKSTDLRALGQYLRELGESFRKTQQRFRKLTR